MIIDKIENLNFYFKKEWTEKVISFWQELSTNTQDGEYTLLEDNKLFCKVLSYMTKQSDWITESHKEYVDFQILLEGEEVIEVYSPQQLVVKNEYSETKDCIFYEYPSTETPTAKILLTSGIVGIFFPQDAHATQMTLNNESQKLKKAVFKVHKSLF